jgi:hypothetical protein
MLKKQITFDNFDGETVVETHYFNLSKPEIIEMQVEDNVGMAKILQNIVDTNDEQEMVKRFKGLILQAYGIKSEDGRRFIKSDQIREEFSQTEAYNTLFMEIVNDDKAAISFINGILPKDLQGEITEANLKAKTAEMLGTKTPTAPPVPPAQ